MQSLDLSVTIPLSWPFPEKKVMSSGMAMSQYSYGKLQGTSFKKQKLPFPGGFDNNGVLTDDPGSIAESRRILPMGY